MLDAVSDIRWEVELDAISAGETKEKSQEIGRIVEILEKITEVRV
jgi:hypothetical protein